MKTNHNGHTLRNLTNRVMAVIDDAEHAQAAVETLERAGVPERELAALSGTEGAREIDSEGTCQGLIEQERHFTADAAHELRTPLAGIRAQAQVARGATNAAERARALDGVMAGCDRATHAVEQMLTLARLAPDAVSFQPTSVELRAVVQATIGELAPIAFAKHMDIELNDGPGAFVSGDAGLLAILFRNLIDNAIRYSAPGTKVDVDIEATASDVRVTIRDTGPGIPAEQRANVGRRFYRAPGTQAPGSGLGLSIVQRILDLHRGTIRLDSPATTSGLQVTIALPRVVG